MKYFPFFLLLLTTWTSYSQSIRIFEVGHYSDHRSYPNAESISTVNTTELPTEYLFIRAGITHGRFDYSIEIPFDIGWHIMQFQAGASTDFSDKWKFGLRFLHISQYHNNLKLNRQIDQQEQVLRLPVYYNGIPYYGGDGTKYRHGYSLGPEIIYHTKGKFNIEQHFGIYLGKMNDQFFDWTWKDPDSNEVRLQNYEFSPGLMTQLQGRSAIWLALLDADKFRISIGAQIDYRFDSYQEKVFVEKYEWTLSSRQTDQFNNSISVFSLRPYMKLKLSRK